MINVLQIKYHIRTPTYWRNKKARKTKTSQVLKMGKRNQQIRLRNNQDPKGIQLVNELIKLKSLMIIQAYTNNAWEKYLKNIKN